MEKSKFLIIILFSFFIISCDSDTIYFKNRDTIYFKNKVKGITPYSLIGTYELERVVNDIILGYDTITFSYNSKDKFIITDNNDTLYIGEIKRKRNNYYLNKKVEGRELWEINSFRIKNDSIYNFYGAVLKYNKGILDNHYFNDFSVTKISESNTEYLVRLVKISSIIRSVFASKTITLSEPMQVK